MTVTVALTVAVVIIVTVDVIRARLRKGRRGLERQDRRGDIRTPAQELPAPGAFDFHHLLVILHVFSATWLCVGA
jgi:hypothetical protein